MIEDKRTQLTSLFDRARVNGVAYLLVIASLGSATRPELSDITGEDEDTLGKYLTRMESRGLCVRVRDGKADRWHLAATATPLLHAADSLLNAPENLSPKISVTPSSSSDHSDRSTLDQKSDQDQRSDQRSDQKSEEEENTGGENRVVEDRGFKAWLCKRYGLTGDKAKAVIADDTLTPEDLIAWMCQVGQMKARGYKFKKSAEAYALHCLAKRDQPTDDAIHLMQIEIDHYWQQYQAQTARTDEPEQPDDTAAELAERQRHQAITAAYNEVARLRQAIDAADLDARPALIAQQRAAHNRWQSLINDR